MDPNPNPPSPEAQDPDLGVPMDGTVELSLEEGEALDLQALADEVAASTSEDDDLQGGALRHKIKELLRKETEHNDKHHRLLADFANYRNRTSREIQMAVDLSEKRLLTEILPVMDSFERCLEASYPSLEGFQSGVALIQKQFLDALRRLGVEPVSLKVGDPYDASHAEALTTAREPSIPDGAVVNVYEKGYLLRNALLRPARVVVNSLEGHEATQGDPNE
jgi:molecular chaperone GrpE